MRNRKKKLRFIYVGFIMALVLLMIGGGYFVYAAMTAQDQKANDFQVGQVETKIEEVFNENIQEVNLDNSIEKDVSIKNTGTINQFVRVMVLPEVRSFINEDDSYVQILPLIIGKDLELENMDANWLDGADGYYYYIGSEVAPDESTNRLFESIKLSSSLSEQYHESDFSIYLKVETINCEESAFRNAWWQGEIPLEEPLKTIDNTLLGLL
ncbi:TasA family protein [Enterococcus sp. AZ163]|uniref:TasA family protein n=1 Tax=Enterococcus sp. AZ163 TaxID=2774638 RepID=UPI003D26B287